MMLILKYSEVIYIIKMEDDTSWVYMKAERVSEE